MAQIPPLPLDQLLIKQIAIAGTPYPAREYLNLIGVSAVDNPAFTDGSGYQVGSTDVTITVTLSQQTVSGGGTVTANKNSVVWADASGGTVTINPPAVAIGGRWGVVDGKKGTSFSGSHWASIPNTSTNIEDPNNPGVYTTNPIVMNQPSQSASWEADPAGTFWKLR
jgi:hypothetical protein